MIGSSNAGTSAAAQQERGRVEDYEGFLAEQMLELIQPGQNTVSDKFRELVNAIVTNSAFAIPTDLSPGEQQALSAFKKFCHVGDPLFGHMSNSAQQTEGKEKAKAALLYLVERNLKQLELICDGTRPPLVDFPEVGGKSKESQLFEAVEQGNILAMVELLDSGANVNACNGRGWSPLMLATHLNNIDAVNLLLSRNAFLNVQSLNSGVTALIIAADIATHNGFTDTRVLTTLLDNEANVHFKTKGGKSALDLIVDLVRSTPALNNSLVIQQIVQRINQMRVQQTAIQSVKVAVVADVNAHTYMPSLLPSYTRPKVTPDQRKQELNERLFAAIESNQPVSALEALIREGAEINARNNRGWTPLITAARFQNFNAADFLINSGADLDARSRSSGCTALMVAIDSSISLNYLEDTRIIDALINAGADATLANNNNMRAHHFCFSRTMFQDADAGFRLAMNTYAQRLQTLSENQILIRQGGLGQPQHTMSSSSARLLPMRPVDMQIALLEIKKFSITLGEMDLQAALALNPGLLDLADNEGETLLMHAAKTGNLNAVSTLLNLNADFTLTDNNGFTARDLASFEGHDKIYKKLGLGLSSDMPSFSPVRAAPSSSMR